MWTVRLTLDLVALMAYHVLLFCVGLAGLYFGAESLVRGAGRLARSLGVGALVIGLTVVAFGTSTPELVVSVMAAMRGQGNLSLGNVVGSNIANIGLILALATLIRPLTIDARLVRRELPLMIVAGLALWYLARDGVLDRVDAGMLSVAFLLYVWVLVRLAKREPRVVEVTFSRFQRVKLHTEPETSRRHVDFALIMIGLAGLVAGANFLILSSVYFARMLGISELTIGLTIVAIGTSLPELATSLLAALRGESDIAMGNVIGSNIFNTLGIVGAAAAARPLTTPPTVLAFELPVMVGASVLLVPMLWTGKRVSRMEGGGLLLLYAGFLIVSVMRHVG